MHTLRESRSNCVKGLCFHPLLPFLIATLQSGEIQLWDSIQSVCVHVFKRDKEGPVRAIDIHKTKDFFVTGADDFTLTVWDFMKKEEMFTLLGHLDSIRTVQFHHKYPWIISASDDNTIRIWSWQSRKCISVITGHNLYVMSAFFHPTENLIVSASLDQTVRIWDFAELVRDQVGAFSLTGEHIAPVQKKASFFDMGTPGNGVVQKFVLRGHERGVNCAAFHPTLPLIVSGANDGNVKLWKLAETKVPRISVHHFILLILLRYQRINLIQLL